MSKLKQNAAKTVTKTKRNTEPKLKRQQKCQRKNKTKMTLKT